MARSQVPKFGNWESEENVPYTAYFDNARKAKNGPKRNPDDPQDDNKISDNIPATQQEAEPKSQKGPEAVISKHQRRMSREDGEMRGLTDSPLRHEDVSRKAAVDSPHHRHGGVGPTDGSKKGTRHNAGSDRSIEQSPLHPHHQARVGNKGSGVSSPSWERKGSTEAPTTPGRSRLRSVTRGDETPDNSPTVPKFGDWDENDPSSAEGYTHIFNKVREERQSAGKVPSMPSESPHANGQKQYGSDTSKGCLCFPWGRK